MSNICFRYGFKVWCMASPTGELLACQSYAGAKTLLPDVGLGQGLNVVHGLAVQYGLSPGSKVSCDNLFTSFDLLDHMGDKEWGVLGKLLSILFYLLLFWNKKMNRLQ